MTWWAALCLTLLVEVPLIVAALIGLGLASPRRAALTAIGVNLVSHPPLWLFLSPHPTLVRLVLAELVVCVVEACGLWASARGDPRILLVLSVGVNAASVAVGLLV